MNAEHQWAAVTVADCLWLFTLWVVKLSYTFLQIAVDALSLHVFRKESKGVKVHQMLLITKLSPLVQEVPESEVTGDWESVSERCHFMFLLFLWS